MSCGPGQGSLGPGQCWPPIGQLSPTLGPDWLQRRRGATSGGSVSLLDAPSSPPPTRPTVSLCPPENSHHNIQQLVSVKSIVFRPGLVTSK